MTHQTTVKSPQSDKHETATFAGGCFWCVESAFNEIPGVEAAVSGYIGGSEVDPTYHEVCSGQTGHFEALQVRYDPSLLSYEDLLWVFWRQIDPTDDGGQFMDRGPQYRTAIFVHNGEQKGLAEASRARLEASGRFEEAIVTQILEAPVFYRAEEYHQNFYITTPLRYGGYRSGSGRDQYLDRVWGDEPHGPHAWEQRLSSTYNRPNDAELKARLTDDQWRVTQENGTEPPFRNAHWNNHSEGIYVDVVSGEPLFSSSHKFDSGTGWPSFFRPLVTENIVEDQDESLGMPRIEVHSRWGGSHLGHLFNDGPRPTGQRYCINSASLRFIPAEDIVSEGYEEFADLFSTDEPQQTGDQR